MGYRCVMAVLCALHLLIAVQGVAQTAVVSGAVKTATGVVRYASVTFLETDNPARSYAAVTDSTGHYHLSLSLTSVAPDITKSNAMPLRRGMCGSLRTKTSLHPGWLLLR